MFPEADSVMQEIEQFIQASPIVKPPVPGLVDQDNYDNHDTPKSLPSPVPTISKSSIPTNVITPTRMVSREKICERAELDSPSSILSSTPARSSPPSGPAPPPTPLSPLVTKSRCSHPSITSHIRLPRKYVKARRQRVVNVTKQILKAKMDAKLEADLEGISKLQVICFKNLYDTLSYGELSEYNKTPPYILVKERNVLYFDNFILVVVTGCREGSEPCCTECREKRGTLLVDLSLMLCMHFPVDVVIQISDFIDYVNYQHLGEFHHYSLEVQWTQQNSNNRTLSSSSNLKLGIFILESINCLFIALFIFANNLFILYNTINIVNYSNVMLMCWPRPISPPLAEEEVRVRE